jgi:glutathione S-transferase
MNAPFRLYGAELSPYSVKVRSYLRYKNVPFEWLARSNARQEEVSRYAKLPLTPILVDADDHALQESTAIIEALERDFGDPSIVPSDPALAYVSALLEDYADEWLNKVMFHYRWSYPDDQASAAARTVAMLFEGVDVPDGIEDSVRTRMAARLHHAGSSAENAAALGASFTRVVGLLEQFLGSRAYLFGGRPSLADFGLAGQLTQLLSDPTPGGVLRARAPNLVLWVDRMENPSAEGPFLSLSALAEGLAPLLRDEVAAAYLTWMSANADGVGSDAPAVSVRIGGDDFTQKPQRYAAKALAELRRKRAAADDEALAALLAETGCDAVLSGTATLASPEMAPDDPDADVGDDEAEEGDED